MFNQATQFLPKATRVIAVAAAAAWRCSTFANETALDVKRDFSVASPVVQDIKFRDFFKLPIGSGGLELSEPLRAAAGQRVRLMGYMVAQEDAPTGRFFLTPVPIRMSEHADGDADDLPPSTVVVIMPEVHRLRAIPRRPGLMQLTGVLQASRQERDDGRVSWVRLILDPPTPSVTAK